MNILTASLRDLPALRKLETACFEKDAWPLFDLVAVLSWPDVIRLKGVEGSEMVGFVAGDPRPSHSWTWIATLGVHPRHRRKGYGRELLRACEALVKLPTIRLTVRTTNTPAIALYESEGYRTVEVWHAYYHDGEAAVLMQKELGADEARGAWMATI